MQVKVNIFVSLALTISMCVLHTKQKDADSAAAVVLLFTIFFYFFM